MFTSQPAEKYMTKGPFKIVDPNLSNLGESSKLN